MMSISADRILARARTVQAEWGALSVPKRCGYLIAMRREIARRSESIAAAIARETGKPMLDALSGDVLVALEQMRFYERHAKRILRSRRAGKPFLFFRGTKFETHFEPHGVALICSPSNYPFQLSVIPLVTALVAGNAVVLKCSPDTPQTAGLIADLCRVANLPPDLVQVLCGGPEEAEALIDAAPDLVFFTGSSENGRQVADRTARNLIPTVLELGGKDAAVVFADCHLKRAVEGIAYGAFSNSGRVCVAVKRVYIEAPVYHEFVEQLTVRVKKLRVDSGPDGDFGPLPEPARDKHLAHVRDALRRGAKLCFPADSLVDKGGPVILAGVPPEARILVEESFAPALCVAPFRDEDEAVALANTSTFGLSGSVWTTDKARARRMAAQICAGSCAINDVLRTIANPHTPFGGNRMSGYGRYHGAEGLRAFSRTKTIMFTNDRRANEVNWFPFTSQTTRQLAAIIRLRHGASLLRELKRLLFTVVTVALMWNSLPAQQPAETRLCILVELTPQAHGELAYLIFASPSGFPGDRSKAVRHGFLPIPGNERVMRIETTLPPGSYAVSLYEDLNGNHRLDHNLLGIPREPVGASNNPAGRFGPPRFADCVIHLGSHAQTISVRMARAL